MEEGSGVEGEGSGVEGEGSGVEGVSGGNIIHAPDSNIFLSVGSQEH